MAVSSPSSNLQTTLEKYGIKPLTKSNILNHYAPLFGVANYGVLAINVMNPNWMVKVSPKRDLTNFLLLGSVVGTGLYISNTKLVKSAPKQKQIMYRSLLFTFGSILLGAVLRNILLDNKLLIVTAGVVSGIILTTISTYTEMTCCSACGSLLFTFGSVLLWAVLRNILPDNKLLAVTAGVVSGVTLTAISKEYLEFIDSKLK